MKLLVDLLPVLLFFIAYKLGMTFPDQALALAGTALGPIISDGKVPADQAPIMLATAVAIAVSLLQVGLLLVRGRKIEPMLWVSLGVIVVFGGATIWLHDETFIKWKPTILYWLFATALAAGQLLWRRNLLKSVLGAQLTLDEPVWRRLVWIWCAFFATIGAANLVVAYSVPTHVWVNFKLFGLLGLTLVFMLGMGMWLSRHMKEEA
jgi:intracellular septation protein